MALRKLLDSLEPHFTKGGKLREVLRSVSKQQTRCFTLSPSKTHNTSHVRDAVDLKRMMGLVWMCTFPAMFFGMWNVGFQANTAIAGGLAAPADWHGWIISLLAGHDPASLWDNMIYGAVYFLPIYMISYLRCRCDSGKSCSRSVRGHEVNEGFFVTSILFALIVPPSIPAVAGSSGYFLRCCYR